MAVFTPVLEVEAKAFLKAWPLSEVVEFTPIAEGVQNTNYRVRTRDAAYVLTLFEGAEEQKGLPFCLGLMQHLGAKGFATPSPVSDLDGRLSGELKGRPAALVEWAAGAWRKSPTLADQHLAGRTLAELHLAGQDYAARRDNPVGPSHWRALAERSATRAEGSDRKMLDEIEGLMPDLARLFDPSLLPQGAIHADYFPDNVLFDGDRIGGVIDFYYGCNGALVYDLAIALSAWGFDAEGRADREAIKAFRQGYESVRPLTAMEASVLPQMGMAAAVRFTLTRLHDRLFHDPAHFVTPKDPAPFWRRTAWWNAPALV